MASFIRGELVDALASTSGRSSSSSSSSGQHHAWSKRSRRRFKCDATHMPAMHNTAPISLRSQAAAAAGGVVKGARTTATPRLTPERVMQRLAETQHETALKHFGSFYSSELGGIVTQPGFMVVPMDDHMVHKGDAVAESVLLVDGYLYQLEARLARFRASAGLAGLPLPMSEERLLRVLLDTAAASMKMNGMLHFWLSRGRGTFGLVDTPCTSLYALLSTEVAYNTHIDRDNGWKAVASPVDPRSAYFTVLRSTSCIQSAVAQLEAYSRGADLGLFVDSAGTVLSGPDCSIAILTRDGALVVPPDDTGLAGMAARNVAELAMQYAGGDDLPIREVQRRLFTTQEVAAAAEAFAISSVIGVVGISHLDDQWIGEGAHEYAEQAGPVSLGLNEMLVADRQYRQGSDRHTEVPYGYMTGMRSQLQ